MEASAHEHAQSPRGVRLARIAVDTDDWRAFDEHCHTFGYMVAADWTDSILMLIAERRRQSGMTPADRVRFRLG